MNNNFKQQKEYFDNKLYTEIKYIVKMFKDGMFNFSELHNKILEHRKRWLLVDFKLLNII